MHSNSKNKENPSKLVFVFMKNLGTKREEKREERWEGGVLNNVTSWPKAELSIITSWLRNMQNKDLSKGLGSFLYIRLVI